MCIRDRHKTARIEHRLGASSEHYNPYLNVIFALLNVIDAIDETTISGAQAQNENGQLPSSLYDMDNTLGAISLFANSEWFSRSIDQVICKTSFNIEDLNLNLNFNNASELTVGQLLQQYYLTLFQPPSIVT